MAKNKQLEAILIKINELDPKCDDHNLSELYNFILKMMKGTK